MRKQKMDFRSIKEESAKIADDVSAKEFIKGAQESKSPDPIKFKVEEQKKKEIKLVVEGLLKNRSETCQKPIQFYIKKDLMEWINKHATSGRGGQQIMLNFLIKKGIEFIECEYMNNGIDLAKE